jgi:mono/diheme cytochrome c family protein
MAGYIDGLVASEGFASEVAPLMILRQLLGQNALGAPEGYVLSHTEAATPIYYLAAPCPAAAAVAVHPWWRLIEGGDETIQVCPDAYRPDQWTSNVAPGEPVTSCLSEAAQAETKGCGCGPNLMRCYRSSAHMQELAQSLRDELQRSVAYNVAHDLPIEQVFTANESFRDRNAEFIRRSYTAEHAHRALPEAALRELAAWPAAGRWAARDDLAPGQNAGVLTAPHLIHYQLDRRQRMTIIDDILWCVEADSVGATPESLLSIVGADLQIKSDGWRDLAARPICTNCHARLDYGLQFFWGFANDNLQAYFVPELQKSGRGPFYVHDIDDRRGDAELTPRGFAGLAVAQPEFRRCMARDVAEYVLGDHVTPAAVAAVEARIRPDATTLRELARAALLQLLAGWPAHADPAPAAPAASGAPRASVAIGGDLHARLETHCLDCHGPDDARDRPDLSPAALPRATVVAVLEAVASGTMPKDQPLARAERAPLLEALIAATWSGADATAARAYFIDHGAALPAYRPELAFSLVHHLAGANQPTSWRMMENAVRSNVQQVTPGFVTVTGLAAIEACREAHKTRPERARCIADAVKLSNLTGARRLERVTP